MPSQASGLQAVDYFLWALQRLYERGEGRYGGVPQFGPVFEDLELH